MCTTTSPEAVKPRSRRRWPRLVALCLALYLLLAAGLYYAPVADRMILFPRQFDAQVDGARRLFVDYQHGQVELWAGRIEGTAEPAAYVLCFHGNGDSADNALAMDSHFFCNQPVEIWAMNFPGYGRSTGPARLDRLGAAGLASFDALQKHAAGKPILVSGNSLGTTIALHVAARRDVAGVVLRDPPALRQVILGEHGWWNAWLFAAPLALSIPSSLDSLANARDARAPALFVFNTGDSVVPYEYQQRVHDAYAGATQAVTLAGNHNELPPGAEATIVREIDAMMTRIVGPVAAR